MVVTIGKKAGSPGSVKGLTSYLNQRKFIRKISKFGLVA